MTTTKDLHQLLNLNCKKHFEDQDDATSKCAASGVTGTTRPARTIVLGTDNSLCALRAIYVVCLICVSTDLVFSTVHIIAPS